MKDARVVVPALLFACALTACSSPTSTPSTNGAGDVPSASMKQHPSATVASTSPSTLFVVSEGFFNDNPTGPGATDSGTTVESFNALTGQANTLAPAGQTQTQAFETSDHGRFLYLASNGIAVEDTTTGKTTFYDPNAIIFGSAKSGDGNTLLFTDGANTVYAFDGTTGFPTRTYAVPNSGPVATDYVATRIYVATPGGSGVTILNASNGRVFTTVQLPGAVSALRLNYNYQELFGLAANDRKVYIVYLNTDKYTGYILEPTTQPMTDIALNEASGTVFVGGNNLIERYVINNYGVPQPKQLYRLPSYLAGRIGYGLAVDQAEQHLYAATANDVVDVSTATGAIARTYPYPSPDPNMSYNPLGVTLGQ